MTDTGLLARQIVIGGQVQGVGFRPAVYRLAHRHGLHGWVRNEMGQVRILVQGRASDIQAFTRELIGTAPAISRPHLLSSDPVALSDHTDFQILPSTGAADPDIHVPPDYYTCADCLKELNDPGDRRYHYPFINCTQCGPRYTLIRELPYDRPNTTMAGFELCPACRAEFNNPLDRRFHAQPLACPECGPQLLFHQPGTVRLNDTRAALAACVAALRDGLIVAVKGIGGYHLMCDARREDSVQRLRHAKPRPHKPLAVLVPAAGDDELSHAQRLAELTVQEAALLRDPMRPIVLVRKHPDSPLAAGIAPGLAEVGLMLPYSPLHHLLANEFAGPLVATSANISGEPVLTDGDEVEQRLSRVAEAFLHHNRPIQRPAEDPVFRSIARRPRPLRLGRGGAPLELTLPVRLKQPVLALGAHMKNTITLAWNDRAVISPHIGELDSPRSMQVFEQVTEDWQTLYKVRARHVVCDAHPNYRNTRWAGQCGLPVIRVFHHHAHAAALYAEHGLHGTALIFTWDGTGYGADGTLWGGEALLGQPGDWRRAASLRPFRLPGGDKAGREPWRSAAAICWEAGLRHTLAEQAITEPALTRQDHALLHQAWQNNVNCPPSSAAGRLFDAAAALTGLLQAGSFEGQAPMLLEACCTGEPLPISLPLAQNETGVWISDWAPLIPMLIDGQHSSGERAARFHQSMAQAVLDQAICLRTDSGVNQVGLSGGVFQNQRLTGKVVELLSANGFAVYLAERVPCNDAGISFGQIIEAAVQLT